MSRPVALYEEITRRVLLAIEGMEPAPERLFVGVTVYLDSCLELSMTKALLSQKRADLDLAWQVAAENSRFAPSPP